MLRGWPYDPAKAKNYQSAGYPGPGQDATASVKSHFVKVNDVKLVGAEIVACETSREPGTPRSLNHEWGAYLTSTTKASRCSITCDGS